MSSVNKKFSFEQASLSIILGINCNRDGVDMKTYTVYRVDYRNNKQELLGKVVERRKEERNNNAAEDMLRLAKKIYGTSSSDSSIFIQKGSSGGPLIGGA